MAIWLGKTAVPDPHLGFVPPRDSCRGRPIVSLWRQLRTYLYQRRGSEGFVELEHTHEIFEVVIIALAHQSRLHHREHDFAEVIGAVHIPRVQHAPS